MTRSLAQAVAISLAWALLVIAVPELLLRAFADPPEDPEPIVGNRHFVEWLGEQAGADTGSLYHTDERLIWRLAQGAQVATTSQHYDRSVGEPQPITITINSEGYRGPKIDAGFPADGLRILCMGDSNFFGYPLSDEFAFPRVLERHLAASGSRQVEVINGATPGYTSVQGWRWFEADFRDYPYNVLLLSYLNNDAWPQRRADLDTLAAHSSAWHPLFAIAEQLWIVRWVRARRELPDEDSLVARVDLATFEERYRRFIDAARERRARVILVDHRAYDEYSPYTLVLQRLAREAAVSWLPVRQAVQAGFAVDRETTRNPKLAARLKRRWGSDKLRRRPHLWYYAEFFPEHLNELGNRYVATLLGDEILGPRQR